MIRVNEKEYLDTKETVNYIISNTPNLPINKGNPYPPMHNRLKKLHLKEHPSVICRDDIYYCDIDFINENIELYKNSQSTNVIYELLKELVPNQKTSFAALILKRFNAYSIDLFSFSTRYINTNVCQEALLKIREVYNKECIEKKELLELIHSTFANLEESGCANKYITRAIKEENLEVIPANYKYNFFSYSASSLYPKETVQNILNYIKKNIHKDLTLINLSMKEYFLLTSDEFNNNYQVLTLDDCIELYWNTTEKYLNHTAELKRMFEKTEVKVIKFNGVAPYVSIKELNELKELMKDYVPASKYFKDLNIGIDFRVPVAQNNNIIGFIFKNLYYIHKSEIERYINIANYNKDLLESDNFYDTFVLKTKYFPHKNETKFPKTKKLFLRFIKSLKRKKNDAQHMFRLYNTIFDNIEVELECYNEVENNELFKVLLSISDNESKKTTGYIITFINYLKKKENFNLLSVSELQTYEEKKPYKPEEFINLLSAMLSVIEDKEKLEKLYGNWQLTSAFAYVFLHFCLAWRRMDLVENLPSVDLSMISSDVSDGELFINWLKDGNKLTYQQSRYICETLEEETARLRKRANKNDEILHCIIPDSLMYEVATLLCINEANKQIYFKHSPRANLAKDDRNFLAGYTNGNKLVSQFKKVDIDIEKILNGSFDNTRMNKGFLSLVRDKAEELNLFSYTCIELLRSHKAKPYQLAETTKIYLNKDVERGSVLAFSTGTMGSVLYLLKELIDNKFNTKALEEKIQDIKELNVTPYGLETSINSISKKVTAMNKELEEYFKSNRSPEDFLVKFLYGQEFQGIEKQTKCLIKITRDETNNLRIAPKDCKSNSSISHCPLKKRSCIGCDYMVALRYFIYEFKKKYDEIITKLENAKSKIDKENFAYMVNYLYIPLIDDLTVVVGDENVSKILDLDRLKKLN